MKKTILFTGSLCGGGAERVVSILAGGLVNTGLETEILLYYDTDIFYQLDPRIRITSIEKETKTKNIIINTIWMRRYLRENANCLISFLSPFNMLAIVASAFLRIPVVVADRNDPWSVPVSRVIRFARDVLYHFADGVVLQTTRNQRYFPKKIREKSTIIFNPLDLGELKGIALTAEKRKEIVAVGRLIKQKNHEMLIRAFAQIHAEYPDHHLTIYGEGPLRERTQALIVELGLNDFVELPGNVCEIHERMAGAELFILCSNYEGMSNALIEAMGLGLPVISTEVSGTTEFITHEKNGVMVPCGDIHALTAAMKRMLDDAELRSRCGTNATQLNERLAADNICKEWIDYLRSVQNQ